MKRLLGLLAFLLIPLAAQAQPAVSNVQLFDTTTGKKATITSSNALKTDSSGSTLTCNIGTSGSLATAANQTTGNGLLTTIDGDTGNIATSAASIDSKTPALGQALAAGSVPVVLTASQLSTLTPPAAITGFATAANQSTIIGHVDGLETLIGTTNTTLTTIAGYLDGVEGYIDGLETLIGTTNTTLSTIDGHVDGLEALVGTTNTNLSTIDGHVDGVEGILTTIDTDTGNIATSASSIDSKVPALGQALSAASVPVVLPASQISTLTPPAAITGYATSANQTTELGYLDGVEGLIGTTNSTLSTIDGHVDGLETLVGTTNTTLSTIDGHVDGLEGTASSQLTSLQLLDDSIFADDAAFTPATSKVNVAGFEYDDSSPDSVDEGDAGAARMSANRNQYMQIRDAAGNERGVNVNSSNELAVSADTELNAAATLADNLVLPSTSIVGSAQEVYDGTNLDLARSIINATNSTGTGIQAAGLVAQLDDTSPTAITENQFGNVRMSSRHALLVEGVASGTAIATTVSSTTSLTPGTAAANLGKAEDAAHATGDTGVMMLGVRRATATDLSAGATDGDYEPYQVDANGRVWTNGIATGDLAHDAVDSGNPVKIGMQAVSALPTRVASADRANAIGDLWGRQLTARIDPTMQIHKSFNATTTQTGTDVWSPTSGKKIAVSSVTVGTYGSTSCRIILWFGDNADTTYTEGTDQALLKFSAAPSSTSFPGVVYAPPSDVFCTTADRELHITTDAGCSLDVVVEGYEW